MALHWQILAALILGALAGVVIPDVVTSVDFVGDLFLKGLRMVIVPLITTSIICGVAGLGGGEGVGRLSGKTLLYYTMTSLLAIVTGLILVNLTQPGVGVDLGLADRPERLAASMDRFGDSPGAALIRLLLDLVPSNPFAAMAEGNMLQIIVFALLFGTFITRLPEAQRKPLESIFTSAFAVMMKLTHFILSFAPLGIFALVGRTVARTGIDVFAGLGIYALTVLLGLLIHACVTLPILLSVLGRLRPHIHAQAMSPALLTAFSTSSSSATLPLTLDCLENRAGVSNRVTSFVAPLGATVNMDGTALYECVAALFIAQAYGVELSILQQGLVVVTALLASIGAAGIPMAGLVMISVILTAVGLPLEGVGLILAVDRVLDMCRTTVNVWSDTCGAALIARSEGEKGLVSLRDQG
ncbi:MAG: dicarboxylate/amino acid:cation symporter [Gemmatimonadetes bacterium]|nr:dicarboxylate/amino acid:cation symporter [Gemmatimonadota bacterium]MBT4612889.1 dicarboxylate/amino acid:cation symporter [Gemmatimonadota bacterium]MBT5059811.1 dicarboxylate/amino acid:cation symporter [Gemmatimonadota bacterium]MBT5141869.1 dicarboxylate/amino acid:cation symporter [Gemmatimonadota bacterium]MBT5589842.1 dicarboxylate/amino acid:cation symporter [Gemmatimonadota bacterium]